MTTRRLRRWIDWHIADITIGISALAIIVSIVAIAITATR